MVVYTQVLAHSCLELGYMQRIAEYVEFFAKYMCTCGADSWIETNGGWVRC